MKKLLLSLLFLLSVSVAFSQIVINSDDLVKAGDIIVIANDNDPDPSIVPGPEGENLTWDFSALSMDDSDTTWVVNPDWTQFAEYFPSSNLAMIQINDSVFSFLNNSQAQLVLQGMVLDISFLGPVILPLDPGEIMAEYPVKYGDSNEQTIIQDIKFGFDTLIIDSVRIKIITEKTDEIDAWGTLTTPMGTFDAIRAHEIRQVSDSFWVHSTLQGWMLIDSMVQEYTTETYNWWSNDDNTGYIVASVEMNTDNQTVEWAGYMHEPPFQSIAENNLGYDVVIYPNPFSYDLNIELNKGSEAIFKVYDNTGRLCFEEKIFDKSTRFNLNNLKPGFYMYRLISTDRNVFKSGKLVKK